MNLLGHHHDHIPFETPDPSDEVAWLYDQRRDLLGLVERQRKELARLDRTNRELEKAMQHMAAEFARPKHRWRRR